MTYSQIAPYIDIHTHNQRCSALTIRSVGVHPWSAESDFSSLEITPEVEAIGEIGLDLCCGVDFSHQKELFDKQLSIAVEHGLPVVIHAVRSMERIIEHIERCRPRAVIIHGFIGSKQLMQRALDRGYYISFGESTIRSPKTVEALRSMPLDRLFFESDVSEKSIESIYEVLCGVMGQSVDDMKSIIYRNYLEIFR